MNKTLLRPVARPPSVVAKPPQHQILVCQTCRHLDRACLPGLALVEKLQAAIAAAGLGTEFEVSGTACMAGCARPCTVAWRATAKATYLFGDIDPEANIDDLVAFARIYRAAEDGWTSAGNRPGKLAEQVLARIPAAVIVTGEGSLQ